jgi:hypothetical protein
MAKINPGSDWMSGTSATTQIGYVNPNHQRCSGHRSVPGTDHLQFAYKVDCLRCGYVYGANGSDLHERRCPECQGGKPGLRYWSDQPRS